jgi:hypothetical protein
MFRGLTGGSRAGQGGKRPFDPLEFRPWMLALVVFLACAIGIAIMERSRDDGQMWAQAAPLGRR